MNRNIFRALLVISVLAASALACNLLTNIRKTGQDVQSAQQTIAAAATDFGGLAGTAEAFATENPGLVETAQGFVTTQGPELMGTAGAFATEATSGQNMPENIPLVDKSTISNQFSTNEMVSYSTTMDTKAVTDFYKTKMPDMGWKYNSDSSVETGDTVMLNYTSGGTTAVVTILKNPLGSGTQVAVVVSK